MMKALDLEDGIAGIVSKVPAIRRTDPVDAPLRSLKEHRVAVLVDDHDRPLDIITDCDIAEALSRAKSAAGSGTAQDLYKRVDRRVYTVHENIDLATAARKIAELNLQTGITVVDGRERYLGYLYNEDVRRRASELAVRASAYVEFVKATDPEAYALAKSLRD